MDLLNDTTVILMLLSFIAGMLTALILTRPRYVSR